jgi:hypothetical protein
MVERFELIATTGKNAKPVNIDNHSTYLTINCFM